MWSIACYPSYTPEGGVPRARRIFRRYLPAEILTYLIINFLWAGLSLWLVSTLFATSIIDRMSTCVGSLNRKESLPPPNNSEENWITRGRPLSGDASNNAQERAAAGAQRRRVYLYPSSSMRPFFSVIFASSSSTRPFALSNTRWTSASFARDKAS